MRLTTERALKIAAEKYSENRLDEARKYLVAILKSKPEQAQANYQLGLVESSLGNIDQCEKYFEIATVADPSQSEFWVSRLESLLASRRFDKARHVFEKMQTEGISVPEIKRLESRLKAASTAKDGARKPLDTVEAQMASGNFKEARKTIKSYLKTSPNDIESLCLSSYVEMVLGNLSEAQKILKKATGIDEKFPAVQANLARLLLRQQKPLEAMAAAKKAYKADGNNPEILIILAGCLLKNNKVIETRSLIETAIKTDPDYAEAYALRAQVMKGQGDYEDALEDMQHAIRIKPGLNSGMAQLGFLHYLLKDFENAVTNLQEAFEADPGNPDLSFTYGDSLREVGRLDEAINVLSTALKKNQKHSGIITSLAIAFRMANKIEEAIKCYNRLLKIKPDACSLHVDLGHIYSQEGRYPEAAELYKKAARLEPDSPMVLFHLGTNYFRLGRMSAAVKILQKSVALDPEYLPVHSNLAQALCEDGKTMEALKCCLKAIAIDPTTKPVRDILGSIFLLQKNYAEAARHLKLGAYTSQQRGFLAKALLLQPEPEPLLEVLRETIEDELTDPLLGSITCRANRRFNFDLPNLFCNHPLTFVEKIDLKASCDFDDIFIRPSKKILNESNGEYKRQGLLINGRQTSGNLFIDYANETLGLKKIISAQIEQYATKHSQSDEGMFRLWPQNFSLSGWLISMKEGGKLKPHIHENGWLSGSVYIQVPKRQNDEGNLVVCKDDEYLDDNSHLSLQVNTGDICLFPASLLHYTIPFQSDEDRIVLAFDVKPKV